MSLFVLRHFLSIEYLSLTNCSIQSQDFNLVLGHFGCIELTWYSGWSLQFATTVPIDLCRSFCSCLAIIFRPEPIKCNLLLKNWICLKLYSFKLFYSSPVDLGEMETESVGSNSTESQTSCQDNDVSISVINIC